jgi:UDP-2-acetamido-2,6-beta-L-arabino-hexul-4-ose reductase
MKVGITGANGQLGYFVRCKLAFHYGFDVTIAGRAEFANPEALQAFAADREVIVHLAGVNRGTDAEVAEGNRTLAEQLIVALSNAPGIRQVIYSSSVQRDLENVYGRAKAAAADALAQGAARSGASFLEVVLPNLFGEFTRPKYNSFVGTFCDQVMAGAELSVHNDNPVNLMHYGEAADLIAAAIAERASGQTRPTGRDTSVATVATMLKAMHADYRLGIIPDLRDRFALNLFNTYRSYVYPAMYPFRLERKADNRGSLFEVVKERNGGQVFYSSTHPGITRGNHFHFDKVERFLVVSGDARISIRKVFTKEVRHFGVSGDAPCFVDMPTMHTHNITNIGDGELLTLFWSHDIFDPARPDTYMEPV